MRLWWAVSDLAVLRAVAVLHVRVVVVLDRQFRKLHVVCVLFAVLLYAGDVHRGGFGCAVVERVFGALIGKCWFHHSGVTFRERICGNSSDVTGVR